MRKNRNLTELASFWSHLKTAEILSIRDRSQTWLAVCPWRCRAGRKARPQRFMSLRLTEVISNVAAWKAVALTECRATTIF